MQTPNEVLELMQKAQVECGGSFLMQAEIRQMTVEHLLLLLLPNNDTFQIKFNNPGIDEPPPKTGRPQDF